VEPRREGRERAVRDRMVSIPKAILILIRESPGFDSETQYQLLLIRFGVVFLSPWNKMWPRTLQYTTKTTSRGLLSCDDE
jgi:hypothetical protein